MNLNKIFVFVILATVLLLHGQAEAGWWRNFGKKLERAGKRIFKATEKALPVIVGIKGLVGR